MINIMQSKASAGAVNLTSDFDDIAVNGIKNLSATLKALIFGFQEDKTSKAAILQGLKVAIEDKKISISSGAAVTATGVYPFFVNRALEKMLTDSEIDAISGGNKYLVLRPKVVVSTDNTVKRLMKTPDGTYEEQAVYNAQSLEYDIEIADSVLNDDLAFGKISKDFVLTKDDGYPVLRLSRTLDKVTDFLDKATESPVGETLVLRDKNGRAQIAAPSSGLDIANKEYTDSQISKEKDARESANKDLQSSIATETSARNKHLSDKLNPHNVTKAQVGLGKCDNTADKDKIVLSATSATKATKDSAEQQINSTYIKALSAAGRTITYTKGDNKTGTITTQDTTYGVATTSANGLMSKADKSKLDGIAAGANKYALPAASASALGGVKTGANITNSGGVISVTKANVTAALGYTPPTKDVATTSALNGPPSNVTKQWSMTGTDGLMSGADKAFIEALKKSVTIKSIDYLVGEGTSNEKTYYYYIINFGNSTSFRFFG